MLEDASGYHEQDGCWNCAAMEDYAGQDECGDYRCVDLRRRASRRHKPPEVTPGGKCIYHQKEQ